MPTEEPPRIIVTTVSASTPLLQEERVVTQPRYMLVDRQTNTVTLMSSRNLSTASAADEQKFHRLADRWRKETFFSSSITNNLTHPDYLRIMAMGERAIPLILRELEERGGHWFMALRYIVDENDNPVPPEHNGKIKLMTEDWLEWGRRNRYL
jgi:hypothetical protein